MNIHLYISNHKTLEGIEDYIYALKGIFNVNENNLTLVDKVTEEADLFLVIEEFTHNPEKLRIELEKAKSLSIKTCLIHTEFINRNLFFNIFSKKDVFFRKLIPTKLILKLKNLSKTNKVAYFPLAALIVIYGLISLLIFLEFKNLNSRLYFAIRDKSLKKFLNIFDYHFSLSEDLTKCFKKNLPNIKIFTLYPPIDKSYLQKIENTNNDMILCFFSGNLTCFRKSTMKKIRTSNTNFLFREKRNNLYKKQFDFQFLKSETKRIKLTCQNIIFLDIIYLQDNLLKEIKKIFTVILRKNILIIELYISQRENWPYLSPMRIIRSLRQGYIPLNIGEYKSILLDEICINVNNISEFKNNANQLILDYKSKIKLKIEKYNHISSLKNNNIIMKIQKKIPNKSNGI